MINLKKLREERGLTQKELTKLTGIAQGTIAGYEMKYRTMKNPKIEYINKIANVLKVSLEEILERPDSEQIKEKEDIKCKSTTCHFKKKGKCDNEIVINSIRPCYQTSSEVRIIKPKKIKK
jgi:transcriptional regulator with XRE-family HTH domain